METAKVHGNKFLLPGSLNVEVKLAAFCSEECMTANAPRVPRTENGSDRSDVDPETGVISLVLRVRVDLALDPLDRRLVIVDIRGVRVRQTARSVAMAGKPLVVAVVVLAVPARGNVGVDVRA